MARGEEKKAHPTGMRLSILVIRNRGQSSRDVLAVDMGLKPTSGRLVDEQFFKRR